MRKNINPSDSPVFWFCCGLLLLFAITSFLNSLLKIVCLHCNLFIFGISANTNRGRKGFTVREEGKDWGPVTGYPRGALFEANQLDKDFQNTARFRYRPMNNIKPVLSETWNQYLLFIRTLHLTILQPLNCFQTSFYPPCLLGRALDVSLVSRGSFYHYYTLIFSNFLKPMALQFTNIPQKQNWTLSPLCKAQIQTDTYMIWRWLKCKLLFLLRTLQEMQ